MAPLQAEGGTSPSPTDVERFKRSKLAALVNPAPDFASALFRALW
jgi:hypothetical protein